MEILRSGLVKPVRLDPTGRAGPTRGQARNKKKWRRSSHGFYEPAWVDGDNVEQRILEASVVVPDGCAITGWAALRWLGARRFKGIGTRGEELPVTILNSTFDINPQPGIAVCGEGTGPAHILDVDGVPVTDPVWSTVFLMRRAATKRQAVVACDLAAYDDLVSLGEVRELISHQSSWTGVPQARWAADNASENAWSPPEVLMRLIWSDDTGLRAPAANLPVFDRSGRHLGTPDLIDVVAGVVGEYDGPDHLERHQRVSDLNRDEVFRSHGLEVVRWMRGDPVDRFLARLRSAYRRAGTASGRRRWTVDAPPWWTDTTSVAARRALTDRDRQRLLRYRAA